MLALTTDGTTWFWYISQVDHRHKPLGNDLSSGKMGYDYTVGRFVAEEQRPAVEDCMQPGESLMFNLEYEQVGMNPAVVLGMLCLSNYDSLASKCSTPISTLSAIIHLSSCSHFHFLALSI